MIIVCPKCGFTRAVDDSKIPSRRVVVHCRSCDHRFPLPVARRIGVAVSKGGVGKTTVSVNLAAGLALMDKKVLLVDTDTQGQASYMLGVKPELGLADVMLGKIPAAEALHQARENLWLLAGGPALSGVRRHIDRSDFGGEMALSEPLTPLSGQFDFIIVDTSPGWDPMTVAVMFYVGELLVPVSLEVMSVQGLTEFLKSYLSIKRYNKELQLKYIVPTFLDRRNDNGTKILERLEEVYGNYLLSPIRYSLRLKESPAFGMTISEYAGGDPVVGDFKDVINDILRGNELIEEE